MTDYLEPYRQMVRGIRFAPPQGQHERFNRLVHQPLPVPPVHDSHQAEVAPISFVALDPGPNPDPSEHAAALVRGAVSKHTVLPLTYNIQENVGDRISRLARPKQAAPLIIAPKIPEPDPNWTPPPPPPIQHLVISTPAQTQVPVASEPILPQTETPIDSNQIPTTVGKTEDLSPQEPELIDSNQIPTTVGKTEDLSPQEPELIDSNQISTTVGETENLSPQEPESIDSNQIPTIVGETEDLSPQEPESIDSNQIPTIVGETEDLSPQEPESIDSNQIPTTVGETEDLSPQEIQPLDLSEATATVENESVIAEKETSVDLNQIQTGVETKEVANQENQPLQDSQIETNFVENEDVVAQENQPIEISQVFPTVESELAAETEKNTVTVESESAISEPEIAAKVSQTAVETEEVVKQDNQPVELSQTLITDESESTVSQLEPLPIVESKKSKSEKLQITCPKCNSGDLRKNGRQKDRQKYLCKDCGRQFLWAGEVESEPKPADEVFTSKPKSSKGKVKKQSKGFGRNKR
ncbi:transposase-like zinc-binding domain-containing protein [Argonema antarcticum]|uniref:IS1/IS1595 family N-terminal zinc-binding domain-containing protein n=1 Tax=Argonema antarcticum TaxID=2942763 RepID=UPI0020111C7D|nr:hypothetical protein [Argonema antarcticum]MCL1472117.1 hypothetical protein [Argonema antarcticum A004/B2]